MMEAGPPDCRQPRLDAHVPVPQSRLRRGTAGKLVLVAGSLLWIASLPLPFFDRTNYGVNPPFHVAIPVVFMLILPLGAINPGNSISVWLRLLAIGYLGGLVSSIVFPAVRHHIPRRWAATWALGTCAGVSTPWLVFVFPHLVAHRDPLGVGMPVFAFAHLLICVGIWLLVPPLWPKEKFSHRLRRWLREL